MSETWVPCCPRCRRELGDPADDSDLATLGTCVTHGDVKSSAAWWGVPLDYGSVGVAHSPRPKTKD